MAGATLTTMDKVLKEFYLPGIQDQFHKKKALLAKLKRGRKQDVRGKSFIIPLATNRHLGNGARAEDADLPTAGSVEWNSMTPSMRYNYGRIRITGPTLEAAKTDRGSFVRGLDAEVKGCEEGLLRSVNRQFNGNGSGVLAVCGTTSTSTTVSVYSTQYLEVGQVIDIEKIDDGTNVASARTITAVDATNLTITISGATVSTTDTVHGIYLQDTRNLEMMGVLGAISASDPEDTEPDAHANGTGYGSLQGLAVATYSFWKSASVDAGTAEITIEKLQDLITEVDLLSGMGDSIDMLYSRHGQFNKFGLLLVNDRRYGGNSTSFEGGFKHLHFDEVKWYFDRDCRKNRVFALNSDDIRIYQMSDLRWADRDGHVLKQVADKDAWTGFLYWYAELGLGKRFSHGVLYGLTE